MAEFSDLRYAHSEGLLQLCRDSQPHSQQKYFISCGPDGDVRVWGKEEDLNDDEPRDYRAAEHDVTAVAWHSKTLYVAKEENGTNVIQRYGFEDGEVGSLAGRSLLRINCIDVDTSGKSLVTGSSDFDVVLIDLSATADYKRLKGHEAPILCVKFDPKGQFIASSSSDGTVKIWDRNLESNNCVKTLTGLPVANDIKMEKSLSQVCFTPDGEYLVVAVHNQLKAFKRGNWECQKTFSNSKLKNCSLSVVSISPCGDYVAAGSVEGDLVVFDWNAGTCLCSETHPNSTIVVSLIWHPAFNDQLVFCDAEGNIGALRNVLVSSPPSPATRLANQLQDDDIMMDDDDDDDVIEMSSKRKRPTLDDDEVSRSSDIGAIKAQYDFLLDEEKDFSNLAQEKPKPQQTFKVPAEPTWKPPERLGSYISGSTPEHLESRFMKWNSVGIVRQFNSEEENSIEVEFHDSSLHPTIYLDNTSTQYVLADLSTKALALGARASDDTPSRLHVRYFGAWDQSSRLWDAELPANEDIELLCVGDGWLAVYTDALFIRLFTIAGVQTHLWSVNASPLTISAHGDKLAVVYCNGMLANDKSANWTSEIMLYSGVLYKQSTPTHKIVPACISPNSSLKWLGFTTQGTLATHDSRGQVRLWSRDLWLPICDTNAEISNKNDNMWLVAVNEFPRQVRAVFCKANAYPTLLPRPTISILPWKLPLCDQGTEKSQLEETLLLSSSTAATLTNQGGAEEELKEVSKSEMDAALKLFHLAARAERDCRALEVAKGVKQTQALQVLINLANRLNRLGLVDKVSEMARERVREEEEQFQPIRESHVTYSQSQESSITEEPLSMRPKPTGLSRGRVSGRDTPPISRVTVESENRADTSIDTPNGLPPLPVSANKRNPFKRSKDNTSDEASISVFDRFGADANKPAAVAAAPENKKRKAEMKQATLSFGNKVSKQTTQSTKPTGFTLWLENNKESLLTQFDGDAADSIAFNKFGVQKFKSLGADEKKKWNDQAKSVINQLSQPVNQSAIDDSSLDISTSQKLQQFAAGE